MDKVKGCIGYEPNKKSRFKLIQKILNKKYGFKLIWKEVEGSVVYTSADDYMKDTKLKV